jgi:hypothetical protein
MERLGRLNKPPEPATAATARGSSSNLSSSFNSSNSTPNSSNHSGEGAGLALQQPALQAGGQQPLSGEASLAAAEAPKGLAAIAAFNKTPREVPKKWCRVVCLCIGFW